MLLFSALELLVAASALLAEALELLIGVVPTEALELLAGGVGLSVEALELLLSAGVELSIDALELFSDGVELLTLSLELFSGGFGLADAELLPAEEDSAPLPPELSEPLEPPQADSTATEPITNSPLIRRWAGHRNFSFRIAFSVMNQMPIVN